MASFENDGKISNLHMYGIKKKFFCPIGKSECTYEIEIDMEPRKIICDYLDVDVFIRGMEYQQTLESACAVICNHMVDEYQPDAAMVKVKCEDAKHMPVEVTKMVRRNICDGSYN